MLIRGGLIGLIFGVLTLLLLVAAVSYPWERYPPGFYEPGLERQAPEMTSVRWATHADDRVWIVTPTGDLWSFREGANTATRHALADPAYGLCAAEERVLVVTGAARNPSSYALRRAQDGAKLAEVASAGEGVVALVCDGPRAILVTTRRILEIAGAQVREAQLSRRLPSRAPAHAAATPRDVFVGFNVGEFGGGLFRIDRISGTVAELNHNPTGERCKGLLNGACDPVSAVAAKPGGSDCVYAAVNEVYAQTYGRLIEVCGARLEQRYAFDCAQVDGMCAIGGFALATTGSATWIVGGEQLLQIGQDGAVTPTPFPRLASYGPFRASFDVPGVVVLLPEADREPNHISPMLIARSPPRPSRG